MNVYKDSIRQKSHSVILEFQDIYDILPKNSKVFIDVDCEKQLEIGKLTADFCLAGSYFTSQSMADYAVSANPEFNKQKLTNNSLINLFKISKKNSCNF